MAIGLHCWVSGKVQGVSFRRYTLLQARALGLCGWVKNLNDGRVEVMVYGETDVVNQLHDWLWQGPPHAKVTEVEALTVPWEIYSDFEIKS